MSRIRIGAPLTLLVAVGCVVGTYLPGASLFGISGGIGSLLLPWTWLRLVTWPFVHANTGHLLSNMMLFLLLSPNLEAKQGKLEYAFCLILTSVVVGVGHLVLGHSNTTLVGASGWVFMMIILSTFTIGEAGTISIPTLIVAALYGWQEVRAALTPNQISQFAHLLGGACGLLFGVLGSGQSRTETLRAATSPSK
jgi:membrane associated rhomboid family serine protease